METDLLRLPEAGIYKYDIADDNQRSRLHLRVDEGGSGLLLINASKIIYLNQTAMAMAYLYLNKIDKEEALDFLTDLFDAPEEALKADYEITIEKIDALIDETSNACPICDLGLSTNMPFSAKLSAPYRMDLAITYRCNLDCAHCYNARARNYPELSTSEWKKQLIKSGR